MNEYTRLKPVAGSRAGVMCIAILLLVPTWAHAQGGALREIIDRDHFHFLLTASLVNCTQDATPDAAITINCYTYRHI